MNFNLSQIKKEDILGDWQVETRHINQSGNLFENIKSLELKENCYKSVNGKIIDGSWKFFIQNEIIYNPQLIFFLGEELINRAIITRLYLDKSSFFRMFLYFQSGLELILARKK